MAKVVGRQISPNLVLDLAYGVFRVLFVLGAGSDTARLGRLRAKPSALVKKQGNAPRSNRIGCWSTAAEAGLILEYIKGIHHGTSRPRFNLNLPPHLLHCFWQDETKEREKVERKRERKHHHPSHDDIRRDRVPAPDWDVGVAGFFIIPVTALGPASPKSRGRSGRFSPGPLQAVGWDPGCPSSIREPVSRIQAPRCVVHQKPRCYPPAGSLRFGG